MIKSILQYTNDILFQESARIESFPLQGDDITIARNLYDTIISIGDLGAGLSAVQIGELKQIAIIRRFDLEKKIQDSKPQDLENLKITVLDSETLGEKEILLWEHISEDLKNKLKNYQRITSKVAKRIFKELDNCLWQIIINPKIEYISKEQNIVWEGCLSVGEGDTQLYAPVKRPEFVKISYQTVSGEHKELSAIGYFSHVVQHEIDHLYGKLFLSLVKNPSNIWVVKKLDEYIDKNGGYPQIV